jgi:hypothetical protein
VNSGAFGPANDAAVEGRILFALDSSALSVRAKAELINSIGQKHPWSQMIAAFEHLLIKYKRTEHAVVLAEVYFDAALDKKPFDCNRSMALLLNCVIRSGTTLSSSAAYNVILSTCVEMKGVEYQSGYAPEDDPEIMAEMNRLISRSAN